MNETYVTLSGWLGADVTLREAGGVPVASFRVASTPRRYQRKTGSWEDGDTQWYRVNAWRALAENCDRSLRRGDPVVVHGKLSAHVWTTKAGMEVTTFEVEASFVGHDLNRGTSTFERRKLTAGLPPADDPVPDGPEPGGTIDAGPEEPAVHAA
ncbi:MAG TPA: single-stranded DNA-binding protein [Nocardioides sp.]|jgi:single-strand DNA-binding protein|nr:single-stranded DNA-binding protein [Nocardioides sp.]